VKFLRKRLNRIRVDMTCPHGRFIPATFRMDAKPHRMGCDKCGVKVTITAPGAQDA
jgi:hypothetical protein